MTYAICMYICSYVMDGFMVFEKKIMERGNCKTLAMNNNNR